MQDHEVTFGEYLEFLNDPETLARIDASDRPILFPREPRNQASGGFLPRRDGRFDLDWRFPQYPLHGVTWEDAVAYAAWWTERARGTGFTFTLPTMAEMNSVRQAFPDRLMVHGDVFRPHWVSCRHSRPSPGNDFVLSYPIDESPHGVFDLTGSMFEWSLDWFAEEKNERALTGGSWSSLTSDELRTTWTIGYAPDASYSVFGIRLVAHREE